MKLKLLIKSKHLLKMIMCITIENPNILADIIVEIYNNNPNANFYA